MGTARLVHHARDVASTRKLDLARRLEPAVGGALAGVIGAGVLLLLITVDGVANGRDFWQPLKAGGALIFGDRAALPGFDLAPVLTGIHGQFLVWLAFGGLFGVLARGRTNTVTMGAVWGGAMGVGLCLLPAMVGLTIGLPMSGIILPAYVTAGMAMGYSYLPFQVVMPPTRAA